MHPSIEGHKRIAAALFDELLSEGFIAPEADWESRRDAAWTAHFAGLDRMYFRRGLRTLEQLRTWTQGRADGPPIETRKDGR